MTNVGAVAANLHEGSRSESFAEPIFRAFGTAVRVPHEEDSGFDFYCTTTERIGQLAWPRHHYTVQVKSAMEPWEFSSAESVRWLVQHPFPLFLCVVDKLTGRLGARASAPDQPVSLRSTEHWRSRGTNAARI